jgi:hypothetical protein
LPPAARDTTGRIDPSDLEKPMAVQAKRMYLDLVVRDYHSLRPACTIVGGSHFPLDGPPPAYVAHEEGGAFTLRCYLSLQGDDTPTAFADGPAPPGASGGQGEQIFCRYDWSFGIALIEKYRWNWMKELPQGTALAVHLVLKPEPFDGGPEAIPAGATLSTLHPSRNTQTVWEQALTALPKTAAEIAKTGGSALPFLGYLSSGVALGSNLLASHNGHKKNWFLYQFLDERLKCPVVEWRITRDVLVEYGPLIRGTLYLAFQRPAGADASTLRMELRPQIRYCESDDICFIVPTDKLKPDEQVAINIRPAA